MEADQKKCCICHGRLKYQNYRNGDSFCDQKCYYYFLENHPDNKPCNCGPVHLDTCIGWLSDKDIHSPFPFLIRDHESDKEGKEEKSDYSEDRYSY